MLLLSVAPVLRTDVVIMGYTLAEVRDYLVPLENIEKKRVGPRPAITRPGR